MTVNLRCANWQQLETMYERDLKRSGFFMKSSKPPPLGTRIEITLSLPSGTTVPLAGEVREHVPAGGLDGRGPGLDLALEPISQNVMWLLETALQSARAQPATLKKAPEAPQASDGGNPDLEAGGEDASVEQEMVDALTQELSSLKRFNAFQVLGVGYGATDDDVRDAFGKLSKRYHPDRFARYRSQRGKHLANEIFILIRDSYRRLADEQSRERMQREIKRDRSGVNPLPVPPLGIPGAPKPEPAPEVVRPSVRESSAIRRTVDLEAEALLAKHDFDAALRVYQAHAKKFPADPGGRAGVELVEGLRALHKGDRMDAAQRLEAALDLDPSNATAASRLADMRRQATTERRGALTKLLQRKGEP